MSGRDIHARPGVGAAAHVLQGRELEIASIHVDHCALIVVDRGIKAVRGGQGTSARALPGQAIVIRAGQTVDFRNTVDDGDRYEARWLVFDAALLEDAYYLEQAAGAGQAPVPLQLLAQVVPDLAEAFERARQALASGASLPDAVVRQRVLEVMHWLLAAGIVLQRPPALAGVAARVRALVAGRLDGLWTADRVAGELALSEATLRRRLATEGTSLSELLVESRMASALTLLQATARPVSDIALAVGYESPSRFAVRFRQRFGFAPSAVRGHGRPSHP